MMYFVYALDDLGYVKGSKRVTDEEHLDKCVEMVKHDFNSPMAHINKAEMCFDGYLAQGDYLGAK